MKQKIKGNWFLSILQWRIIFDNFISCGTKKRVKRVDICQNIFLAFSELSPMSRLIHHAVSLSKNSTRNHEKNCKKTNWNAPNRLNAHFISFFKEKSDFLEEKKITAFDCHRLAVGTTEKTTEKEWRNHMLNNSFFQLLFECKQIKHIHFFFARMHFSGQARDQNVAKSYLRAQTKRY